VSGPTETILTENPFNFKRLLKSKFMSNEKHQNKTILTIYTGYSVHENYTRGAKND